MPTPAQRVIAAATRRLGTIEMPKGSNDDLGGWITGINRKWGLYRQPWCNMATDKWFEEAGVSDEGIQSPATWITEANARARGFITKNPVPGSLICWPGKHIGIVEKVYSPTLVGTIEGNSDDQVQRRTRSSSGAVFITVPAIAQAAVRPPQPIRIWSFEDPQAPRLHPGKWRSKLFAQRAKRKLGGLGRRAKLTKRDGRWRILMPREHRFNTKAGRDTWMRKAEQKWGRKMRPTTRLLHPRTTTQTQADGLGKTT